MTARRRLRTRYERPGKAEPRPWPAEPETSIPPSPSDRAPAAAAQTPAAKGPVLEGNAPVFQAPQAPPGGRAAEGARDRAAPLEPAPSLEVAAPSEDARRVQAGEIVAAAAPALQAAAVVPVARRHRFAAFWLMLGLAVTAFATGLVVFNSLVMPRLIHGIGEVRVPDVRNLTLEQAEQALRSLDLQVSRAGERFDPAVPRGFVLWQDPSAGTAVRGRKRISVVVSLGEEFSSVPELFGESQRSAEGLLRSAGLRLGVITRAPSEEVGEGLVAGSDPGPETVLPRDSPVSLLVSTGAGEESFVMPDLVGREVSSVRRQLDALGFRVQAPPGTASIGTIVTQSPAPGSRITRATTIQLQATGRMIR